MTHDTSQRGEFQRVRGRYPGYTRTRLTQFARRLKRAIYPDRAAVERIELAGPTDRIAFEQAKTLDYREAALGAPLGPLWATYWARVTARIPEAWRGSRVDLYWDSRSEALLWVNGRSTQGLNSGRHTAPQGRRDRHSIYRDRVQPRLRCRRSRTPAGRALPARSLRYPPLRSRRPGRCSMISTWLRQLEADREPPQTPRSTGGVAPKLVRPALDTTWAGKLLHDLNASATCSIPMTTRHGMRAGRSLPACFR
ncbi:MAG: hypothetical protein WDM81_08275 [Rhizomicrobium sp.]